MTLPTRVRLLGGMVRRATGPIATMDESRRARLRDPQAPRLISDLLNGRPAQHVETTDTVASAPGRDIPVRIYRPSAREGEPLPLVVHFPGGGWMFASPRSSEHLCSHLAERLSAVVVSVGYRLSPEHPAPAALEDALAATAWAHAHARVLGARDGRLAVMGDSSGGTLAAGVALADKEAVAPLVAAQALIYPLTDLTGSGASVDARPDEPFLSRDDLHAYLAAYLAGGADPRDPLLSPLWAPDLAGLSPALVLAADHDPLVDDARRYVDRLRASDVPVEHVEYADSPHGFMTFPRACAAAESALERVVSWLREVLSRPEETAPPGPGHWQPAHGPDDGRRADSGG